MTKSLLTVAAMALSIQAINAAEAVVAEVDFSKTESYDMYHSDHVTPIIQDGALYINNTTAGLNFWDVQYFVLDGFDLENGADYTITAKVKGFTGNLPISMGSWDSSFGSELNFEETSDWQTVSRTVTSTVTASGCHLTFQSGNYTAPYWIESVKIAREVDDPNGVVVEDAYVDFSTTTDVPDHSENLELKLENGALVVTNGQQRPFWEVQYFPIKDIKIAKGVRYTVTAKIKGFSGKFNYNLGSWGQDNDGEFMVNESADWQEISSKVTSQFDIDNAFLLFQPEFVGTYEIAWIKVTHVEIPAEPEDPNLVASFYTGNGKTFGGWGDNTTFENVTEDDKPCLKFTHTTAAEYYAAQIAMDLSLESSVEYVMTFDVKGNPAQNIWASMQNADTWAGCGDFNRFDISDQWNSVSISGICQTEARRGEFNGRIVVNLGEYVGTLYLTNVKISKKSTTTSISEIEVEEPEHWTVYTMMGIKVLDTNDKGELGNLPAGLYIINGKKVAIRK